MNPWKVSDDVRLTVPFGHLASSIALASVLPCRDCAQPINQTISRPLAVERGRAAGIDFKFEFRSRVHAPWCDDGTVGTFATSSGVGPSSEHVLHPFLKV